MSTIANSPSSIPRHGKGIPGRRKDALSSKVPPAHKDGITLRSIPFPECSPSTEWKTVATRIQNPDLWLSKYDALGSAQSDGPIYKVFITCGRKSLRKNPLNCMLSLTSPPPTRCPKARTQLEMKLSVLKNLPASDIFVTTVKLSFPPSSETPRATTPNHRFG